MDRVDVRSSVVVLCVAVPPLLLAVSIAGVLALAAIGVHPLWRSVELTTAEAAALADDAAFVRRVLAGADPNAPAPVRTGTIGSAEQTLTPLEAAILSREVRTVKTVLKYGARLDGEAGRTAVCSAIRRAPHLVSVLLAHGAADIPPPLCSSEAS
jgi:hypothetical protein